MESTVDLTDVSRCGVYVLPAKWRASLEKEAKARQLGTFVVELGNSPDLPDALARFGQACRFPDWYGGNLDALHDCLSDPDWPPPIGHVLFISGLEQLRHRVAEELPVLVEVLQSAVENCRADGRPLWIALTAPLRGIATFPQHCP